MSLCEQLCRYGGILKIPEIDMLLFKFNFSGLLESIDNQNIMLS